MSFYAKRDRQTWSEPCVCGRDIRVANLPTDRAAWTQQDWVAIGNAVKLHQGTPEHVAYRLGYRARILPQTWCADGLPIVGGLE